jgi:poly-gamma-glutamate synthesis protein (capsule biosynthesis protein)
MKILLTGDLFVSDRYRDRSLFDPSVAALFAAADYRVVNLEAPITAGADEHRILKTGPHLRADKDTALPLLRGLRIDLVTLANNHIMDYGRPGLVETLENLKAARIGAVGAGRDLDEAARPFLLEKDGTRIAVLNFGENEWASAGPGRAGANPSDVVVNVNRIREARRTSDAVIVIIHGGQEDFHFPTPRMVREYRFYAENGASAIVGHHPHCTGGIEVHQGCPIFYSLGNFLFTLPSEYDWWYTGLALTLGLERGEAAAWELVPVAQSRSGFTVTRLDGERADAVRRDIEEYSRIVADETRLLRQWEAFLTAYEGYYLNVFNPLNIIPNDHVKTALAKLGIDRLFVTKSQYAQILNTLRCESHAEAAKGVLERLLK